MLTGGIVMHFRVQKVNKTKEYSFTYLCSLYLCSEAKFKLVYIIKKIKIK